MRKTGEDFSALAALDTPTACNALELVLGERREFGFTRRTMMAVPGEVRAFAGRAATATIRATRRPGPGAGMGTDGWERRLAYYRATCVAGAVAVIEDVDDPPGLGAFWGEVHSAVHAALGVVGVATNGAVRDLDALDPRLPIVAGGVSPSHAFVEVEAVGVPVNIFGMAVAPGDIVHADRHGAAVIPERAAADIPRAAELLMRREREVLAAARRADFSPEKLAEALVRAREIR